MTIRKCTSALLMLMVAACIAGAGPAMAQLKVGEEYPTYIDSARDYPGSPDGSLVLAWEQEIQHPGATYIAVHFSEFQLASGDYLLVSDSQGGQAYKLTDRGKMNAGQFWARHIKGESALLRLYSGNRSGARGFVIDKLVAGYEDLGTHGGTEAICGLDDKENAVCYETTYPTEYDRSRAVARMLISGAYLCTGWLVSAENHLLTNEHCVTSATEALNTDFEFMAEAPSCGSSNCQLCYPGAAYDGATFIQDNAGLDYSLLKLSGSPASLYGYLQIDDRVATVGERIYIPQHPAGRAKELAIESSAAGDTGGLCRVTSITSAPCSGSGYNDVGYYCDTEGGSSGSPVLAASSHKVIALHHCANCPNRGVPIHLVWDQISGLIGPECVVDADCDDGQFCNGTESCSGGACQDGSDPCPGENCDEGADQCVPLVCDNDGTCEAGEDCTDCSGDCIGGTSGAVCGNNICETGAGEDCHNCPGDCNGVTGGKPSNRYCCGDTESCADSRCAGSGNSCSTGGGGVSYCCGDGTCEGDEDSFNCAVDCGSAPECGDGSCDSGSGEDSCTCPADCGAPASSEIPGQTCSDGDDNDCDGLTDCADGECSADQQCSCKSRGETCGTDGECCSNRCHRSACK